MKADKSQLRSIYKNLRLQLTKEDVASKSQQISENFLKNLLPKIYQKNSEDIFSLYLSSGNEVSTDLIADYFLKNAIPFAYPKILNKNEPLKFVAAKQNQRFAANLIYPKILEPVDETEVVPNFLILPLVAFDPSLARIGMGAGFFDRTISQLKKQNHKITTIGLAYDLQGFAGIIKTEINDQKLDFIVTEKNIFSGESIVA